MDYEQYKICIIVGTICLIVGFSIWFGLGKKEVPFEKGISLVMFTVWLIWLVVYGATDKDMPLLLNSVGAGAALTLMGLNAGNYLKDILQTKLWR